MLSFIARSLITVYYINNFWNPSRREGRGISRKGQTTQLGAVGDKRIGSMICELVCGEPTDSLLNGLMSALAGGGVGASPRRATGLSIERCNSERVGGREGSG